MRTATDTPAALIPEIVEGTFELELWPSVFTHVGRQVLELPDGLTVKEALERADWELDGCTVAYLGGIDVPLHAWPRVRPRAGSRLTVLRRPADPATVAAIGAFFKAVFAGVAAGVTGTASVTGAVGAGVGATGTAIGFTGGFIAFSAGVVIGTVGVAVGLSALANSLVDAPDQDAGSSSSGRASPTLTGSGNRVRQNEPIPDIYGDHRVFPPLGALPFSMVRGADNVVRLLFIIGHGPMVISEPMIGEVPLTSFTRARIATREGRFFDGPLTIFTNRVFQVSLNNVFQERVANETPIGPWVQVHIPGEGIDEISIDLNFASGLIRRNENGKLRSFSTGVQIQYRDSVAPGAWQNALIVSGFGPLAGVDGAPTFVSAQGQIVLRFLADNTRPFMVGLGWRTGAVSATGEYDVRIRRFETEPPEARTGGGNESIIASAFVWSAARGLNFVSPLGPLTGIATVELELPLDEQFSGFSANFSVRVARECRIYDPADAFGADADGWSLGPRPTRNPAAALRSILQGNAKRVKFTDAELDVASFTAFYQHCAAFNQVGSGPFTFDYVYDFLGTVQQQAQLAASSGRGQLTKVDNKLTVVVDKDQSATPSKALITPITSQGFRYRFTYSRKIHGIKAQFTDRDEGFDPQGMLIVYADGYSQLGTGGTLVADENQMDTIRFSGTTSRQLVFVQCRWMLANRALQRAVLEVSQDLEHLTYKLGEVVKVSHDGLLLGSRWGLVKTSFPYRYFEPFEESRNPYAADVKSISNGSVEWAVRETGFFTEGLGSAKCVTTAASLSAVTHDFGAGAAKDWTGLVVQLDARAPEAAAYNSTDGLRLVIYGPTLADFRIWNYGSGDSLSHTVMQTLASVTIGTTTPDATGGTFDATKVRAWEIRFNVVGAGAAKTWWFDNLRIRTADATLIGAIVLDGPVDMPAGQSYRLEVRKVNTSTVLPELLQYDVRGPIEEGLSAGIADAPWVFLKTPVAGSPAPFLPGDLYAFGTQTAVTGRFLVKSKTAGRDGTAVVTLVDEAPARFNAVTTIDVTAPATELAVPVSQVGPSKPNIVSAVADERALLVQRDGALTPRIALLLQASAERGRSAPAFWGLRYRRTDGGETGYKLVPPVPASSNLVYVNEVDELGTYEVLARGIDSGGRPSDEASVTVFVSGKTNPPPDVSSFRLENGDTLRWNLGEVPIDFAGFRIKRGRVGGAYSAAVSIHGEMLLAAPPFVLKDLAPGDYTFYVVQVDKAGNESVIPAQISGTFGGFLEQNVVNTFDFHAAGFPKYPAEEVEALLDFENVDDFETIVATLPAENYPQFSAIENPNGTIFTQVTNILGGLKSCRCLGGAGVPIFRVTYTETLDVTDRKLEFSLYINRAGASAFTVAVTFRSDGATNTSTYNTLNVSGQVIRFIRADLAMAPDSITGAGVTDGDLESIQIAVTGGGFTTTDSFDIDDLVWKAGTVDTVMVEGGTGDLVTINASGFYPDILSGPMYSENPSDLFYQGAYKEGRYFFKVDIGAADVPCDLHFEMSATDTQTRILYHSQDALFYGASGDPFYDPDGDGLIYDQQGLLFVEFPGTLRQLVPTTYLFLLEIEGGAKLGRVESMVAVIDVEDAAEVIEDTVISSGGSGTRLPILKSYREIRKVDLVVQTDGNGGRYAILFDKDPTLGPMVQVYNGSNARVTGLVDARVTGVKGA